MLDQNTKNFFKNKNCLITGGTGMIGREIAIILLNAGANVRVISLDKIKIHEKIDHVYGDLTNFEFCKEQTKDMDCVFHVAGIKGSVKVTLEKPASFFVPLLMFNTNVLEASRINNVKKLVYTSSIGAYSSNEVFIESDDENQGPPMDMFPGWAKRMAEMQIKAYQIQYNLENYSIVRPCNVYGPGDNYHPNNSHVIPGIIHRLHEAKIKNSPSVIIWGTGKPKREFLYVDDMVRASVYLMNLDKKTYETQTSPMSGHINVGCGEDLSIKELSEIIKEIVGFKGEIVFDPSKPDGSPKKLLNSEKINNLGFKPQISLKEGLIKTYREFIKA